MKTIKIMSDGNIARVGMICAYIENEKPLRIEIGIITNIKNGVTEKFCNSIESHDVIFKPINAIYHWSCSYHFASLKNLSKANKEQKKLYWLELEKQTIQFRPEFETKLKELGIRDQFVNNLFDPKWCDILLTVPHKKRCLSTTFWHDFIGYAFNWSNSSEGYDYWSNVAQK